MKAVLAAFNQEKALVGAFSVITNLRKDIFEALLATVAVLIGQFRMRPAHANVPDVTAQCQCRAIHSHHDVVMVDTADTELQNIPFKILVRTLTIKYQPNVTSWHR